jgi:type IV pilus assembly protein PilA
MRIKKGFTLIELMIVLAIIAILAVVLIPKAGSMKDSARNSGVITNANNVRGYLETKTGINFLSPVATLTTNLSNNYGGTNAFANPFNSSSTLAVTEAIATTQVPAADNTAIAVYNAGATISAVGAITSIPGNKGITYVYLCTDGYIVFGVDSAGSVVDLQDIYKN